MTKKEWAAVAVLVGGGIVLQIPSHTEMDMGAEAMGSTDMSAQMAEVVGPFEQVALDVTGMT